MLGGSFHLGQVATVMGGLAVAPFPFSSVKGDLKILGKESGLPPIGHFEIELKRSACAVGPLFDALETYVVTFAAANRRLRERASGTKRT